MIRVNLLTLMDGKALWLSVRKSKPSFSLIHHLSPLLCLYELLSSYRWVDRQYHYHCQYNVIDLVTPKSAKQKNSDIEDVSDKKWSRLNYSIAR